MSKQPKILLATDGWLGEQKVFTSDQLQEAKDWLQKQFEETKEPAQEVSLDLWQIQELQPGQYPDIIYSLEELYSSDQMQFVNFLIERKYIQAQKKISLLRLLQDSEYEVCKKQKTKN